MKIRQVWKLNQQYLQETMVFRSRRFSDVLAEVMRKTELRPCANEDAEMRRPKDQVDVPNRCGPAKRAVRFRNSAVDMISIFF